MRIDEFEYLADHMTDQVDRFRIVTVGFEFIQAIPYFCSQVLHSVIDPTIWGGSDIIDESTLHSVLDEEIVLDGDLCR